MVCGTYMLIDEYNGYVFPIMREPDECLFNRGGFRLGVNNEEVFLSIWRRGYVLDSGVSSIVSY